MAVLATGAIIWGVGAGPAAADSIRDNQWALKNYHAVTDVWPVSQGADVIVAVIDSGVTADHQDLVGSVLSGADFSGDKTDGHVDSDGHGTAMAGIIAAHGHGNGDQEGISGLAPKAKILPIKVGLARMAEGGGSAAGVPDAIRYAVDHGAKVINMSFGADASAESRAAVNYAVSKDVVLVAGSGNDANFEAKVAYPAAFPGVVAVGAVDQQGTVWDKSNRGPQVTLVAPGVDIASTSRKSTTAYGMANGTSDATAYVSAIAALVRSKYPDLSAGQVINRMIKSAVAPPDKSAVPNDRYGYGIASPREALKANPAVDNGPRENPLLGRAESGSGDGAPSAAAPSQPGSGDAAKPGQVANTGKDDSGTPGYVFVIAGLVALLVIVGVVIVIVRRSRGNGSGGPGGPGGGGGGGFVPPGPPPYGPGAQHFPPQQPPYAGQVPQPQGSVYGAPQGYPQPPGGTGGGGGNAYR
ncbi:type VII secretion-associated serine protease mycosin [Kitasatospora paranensis]|uniref:Type VII secretion-associated serine protease mycosin n=1 Tax=Kitasatospora paranensis TaxID=258053 RepID=A0ABW2FY42_9ACTN